MNGMHRVIRFNRMQKNRKFGSKSKCLRRLTQSIDTHGRSETISGIFTNYLIIRDVL